jgi:hypothetical protein
VRWKLTGSRWLLAAGKTLKGTKPWKGWAFDLLALVRKSVAHGGALVKLCRGAKACERITRNVDSLRGGDGAETSEPGQPGASVPKAAANGKEGSR